MKMTKNIVVFIEEYSMKRGKEDVYCKGFWKVVRTIAVLLEIIILIKFDWTRFQSE
jgi:hypothetical protein